LFNTHECRIRQKTNAVERSMNEEEQLVGRILAGDTDAEEDFHRIFQPRLLRAARFFLGGQDSEAEDIVQATFIIAFPKLKTYVFRAPIYAWLRQICLRLCYARIRTRKRVLVSLEEDLEVFMQRLAVERLRTKDFEEVKQHRLDLLRGLMKQLRPDSLRIIEMRDVQGMRYAAISQALGIPMGTVMSRLARARGQLRELAVEALQKADQEPATGSQAGITDRVSPFSVAPSKSLK
jgi:RNA polymerase sigma-70 factor, ECF subfamily